MNVYKIPESISSEIDDLEKLMVKFTNGDVQESELKAYRVPFGVYEQRVKGKYMARIRFPAGIVTPKQFKAAAKASQRYGSGLLHITTRQELQIHDVPVENIIPLLRELLKWGMSTRGGGGNTVRNIIGSYDSGVSVDEVFDISPYAVSLTEQMVARSDSWLLPRKYKIAFSNTPGDNSFAGINDIGFIASVRDGVEGFRVYVAGGLGRMSQSGILLHEFISADEVFYSAEAVKRVFYKYGNRKNKHSARLRFLLNNMGEELFREKYETERASLKKVFRAFPKPKDIDLTNGLTGHTPLDVSGEDFDLWKNRYVKAQKQTGLYSVMVPFMHGILNSEDAINLAGFLEGFGEDVMRFTPDQNISVRNIPKNFLGLVFLKLREVTDLWNKPFLFGQSVACAGASTCQLGMCISRGALKATLDILEKSQLDADKVSDVRMHFSGCSNNCGKHSSAHLGFFGKAGRKGKHIYPAYNVVAGYQVVENGSDQLAEKIDEISAKDLPHFTYELLSHYAQKKHLFPSFGAYLEKEGFEVIRSICSSFRDIPDYQEESSYYYDWESKEKFSLAGRGTGECSAGLFDLIELDLAKLRKLRKELEVDSKDKVLLKDLLLTAARMLLVTRGLEATDYAQTIKLFRDNFIQAGLIGEEHRGVVDGALDENPDFQNRFTEIRALADAVERLYLSMDDSLQFHTEDLEKSKEEKIAIKDFRGVACPMNFVKTKMALSHLNRGEILGVLLDDGEPIENVPGSVAAEGHEVLSKEKIDDHWKLVIKKSNT
ncbi:Ferredoxin--sulfite reductase [Chitinispirillum alkaliphilum]|nr:Ferredoxin--sulfite reductase [Chitinispirillum alkaliphilum]